MKKIIALLLCILMLSGILAMPVSALNYYVSHYEENIYAGGIVDLYAYPSEGSPEDYTYQWQYDAGFGGNSSWYDVPENSSYSGGKTNHLQIHTSTGNYDGWEAIPFQCVVTSSDGTVRKTNNITIEIYPTDKLIPNMKNWGYGLWDPNVTNVTGLYTNDEVNYTASAYAGAKLQMFIGSKSIDDKQILRKSEVDLKTEIHIIENGHTTISTNNTSYIPYTVGQLKVEFKQKATIGGHDLGYFDTKTVNITLAQPTTRMTAQAKSDCSLLRYTYNESQKLASIPKGTTLNIVGEDGSYYQVYHNGYVGYVGKSSVSSTSDATGKRISNVDVTIPKPIAGQTPASTCSIDTTGCELYKTDPITWTDESGKIVKTTDKFQEGQKYTVSIWVTAKSGYEFQTDAYGKPKLTGSINGNLPPYINKAYEQDPKEVIELTYTFAGAQKAQETTEPPKTTTPTTPAHTHTLSNWRTTGIYHYKVCTVCGEFLEQEDHKGGIATCSAKGKCSVCGYDYIDENENHIPDTSKWVARVDMYHYHACKYCGAHCDIEDHRWSPTYLYQDATGHAWICADCKALSAIEPHTPGSAATETTPQTCKDCGYIIEPAKNHKHELTKVPQAPATCIEEGNIEYYTCSGCSDRFTDAAGKHTIPKDMSVAVGALGHTASEKWNHDAQYHWRTCNVCLAILEETKMLHEGEDDKCATCGYMISSGQPNAESSPKETTQPVLAESAPTEVSVSENKAAETVQQEQSPPKQKKVGVNWASAVLIGASTFGATVTATVIILKKQKK